MVELTAQREAAASTSAAPRQVDESAGLRVLIRNYGDESLASEPFIYMPTMVSDGSEVNLFIFEIPSLK